MFQISTLIGKYLARTSCTLTPGRFNYFVIDRGDSEMYVNLFYVFRIDIGFVFVTKIKILLKNIQYSL